MTLPTSGYSLAGQLQGIDGTSWCTFSNISTVNAADPFAGGWQSSICGSLSRSSLVVVNDTSSDYLNPAWGTTYSCSNTTALVLGLARFPAGTTTGTALECSLVPALKLRQMKYDSKTQAAVRIPDSVDVHLGEIHPNLISRTASILSQVLAERVASVEIWTLMDGGLNPNATVTVSVSISFFLCVGARRI